MNAYTLLVERFNRMSAVRREVEQKCNDNHEFGAANAAGAAAQAYERCAHEVSRVIAGEAPPPVGHEWPEPQP